MQDQKNSEDVERIIFVQMSYHIGTYRVGTHYRGNARRLPTEQVEKSGLLVDVTEGCRACRESLEECAENGGCNQ